MTRPMLLAAVALGAAAPGMAQDAAPPVAAGAPAYDPVAARQAIGQLADELEISFVFPDVAKRYAAALRTRLAAGGYDAIRDRAALAAAVTDDLQAVAPDGHLAMHATDGRPPAPRGGEGAQPGPRPDHPPLMEQAGMIAPGIAFVRFNAFMGDPAVLADFTRFLDTHAGAKTLIIDARTHRGGGLDEMDVLFPRLFAEPVAVMTMDMRAEVARRHGGLPFASLVQVPSSPEIFRTEHRVTPATPASPWTRAKVYVLTSGRTASAAEHLSMALKASGRATLVGDTTAGAGHFGGTIPLPGGYSAFMPGGRSYFPGGDGWEGTGIAPDVAVAPERALHTVLIREGIAPAEAERLSAAHAPTGTMTRRRPLRS